MYSFVQNAQRYVVDLEGGQFFPIDEIVWDILQVCPAPSLNALLDSLRDRYPERTVLEGLWKLSRFAQLGYLVDGELFRLVLLPQDRDRHRLFWMQDFLYLNLPYKRTFGHVDSLPIAPDLSPTCRSPHWRSRRGPRSV